MKNYIDVFWEKLKQQTKKRRRAISIMLVLSLVVSSTVVWSLHGTGITMVNEEMCGMMLHSHTDECYSDVLICGLDESEEHTHSAECYERQLTCVLPEHIHTAECYMDGQSGKISAEPEEPVGDAEAIGAEIAGDENIMKMSADEPLSDDEEIVDADLSEMGISPEMIQLQGETHPELDLAPLTGLPDTRKDGIVINFFDYGNEEIDVSGNHYGGTLVYKGINKRRTYDDDILFLGQGGDSGSGKNRFAQNNGYAPVLGIVNKTLTDGYPTIVGSNNSLDYLFDLNPITEEDAKVVYPDVGNLLQKDADGYYFYNSDTNYVYFDTEQDEPMDFIVYNKTYGIISDTHHNKGDPKPGGGTYTDEKDPMPIGFFPFNEYDPSKTNPNVAGKQYSHHFGMTLEADFEIPYDPNADPGEEYSYMGKDVIFEYSGDDDMWIFVDGVLVLDVGGIHRPLKGSINFSDDKVEYQSGGDKKTAVMTDGTISDAFKAAGKKWDATAEHHIQMFYLERGGCNSNLYMKFNLPTIQTINVSKKLDKGTNYTKEYDDQTYSFQLYSKSSATSDDDELYTGSYEYKGEYIPLDDDGIFTVNPNESVSFHGLDKDKYYYVRELEVDSSDYSDVIINNNDTELPWGSGLHNVSSSVQKLDRTLNYDFVNKVGEETIDIKVEKQWSDSASQNHSNDKVLFRIIRTDENNVKNYMVINGRKTFVLDENNNWSMSIDNLVTRYGSHTYSYSVEEVSVPDGYTPSYTTNTLSDGTVQYLITNVSTSQVEIHVKKEWLDSSGNAAKTHPDSITFDLKRHYYIYGNPTAAEITVNLLDSNGNIVSSETSEAAYEGGSIEFTPDVPYDAELLSAVGTDCKVSEADGVFEATDIEDGAVVDLKYDNFSGAEVYAHSSLADKCAGWTANGGSITWLDAISKDDSSAGDKGAAMKVGKSGNDDGAYFELDSSDFQAGSTYGFSIYVISRKGRNYEFLLSYTDKNGTAKTKEIASASYKSQENDYVWKWIHLSDTDFEMPEYDTSKKIGIIIKTNTDGGTFYFGDFFAVKGGYDTIDIDDSGNIAVTPTPEIKFFEDTAIAKPVPIDDGDETVFQNVTLDKNNEWTISWDKNALNEIAGRTYVYKVTETTDDPRYLVSYENNSVSSNTADTPIIIKNTENMYELPATGGIGTKRIVFGGTFLILISLLSGYCVAKRERREE